MTRSSRSTYGGTAAALAAGCALALAYLSFLPFEVRPLPLPAAIAAFKEIQLLRLGPENRADWVANILLYIPLGFLVAAALGNPGSRNGFARLGTALGALVLCAAWAVAIEFGQVYFAPRTVSLNDIAAEWIGSALGASAWWFGGPHAHAWWERLRRGGHFTARAALAGYAAVYVAVSLFPFDFVTGWRELDERLATAPPALWFTEGSCSGAGCWARFLVDVVAVAPLGWWLAARLQPARMRPVRALLAGAALGLLIEAGQLLIVSGISQGASIAARSLGMLAGVLLFERRSALAQFDYKRYGKWIVLVAAPAYLLAVAYLNGWFSSRGLGFDEGMRRLGEVRFLPFFYHYFTTETAAFRSLLAHTALYAPVGIACWLWAAGRSEGRGHAGVVAALLAAVLAAVAELGKLFFGGRRPDPTDALVAAAAAWATVRLLEAATGRRAHSPVAAPVGPERLGGDASDRSSGRRPVDVAAGSLLLAVAAWSIAAFPLWRGIIAAGAIAYGLALTRWPSAYLLLLPAALPVLDLAPWSGRFFWDEMDILLAMTAGVLLVGGKLEAPRPLSRASGLVLAFFVAAALVSAAVGLLPFAAIDANAFADYLSPYSAVRHLKPVLWALVLLWLMRRSELDPDASTGRLFTGLALGNVAASASVAWERAATVGLFDFSSDYRVSGLVSAMHTGGASLDGFLVLSLPFVLLQIVHARGALPRACWVLAGAAGAYAVFVTFSRGALLGLAAAILAWACGLALRRSGDRSGAGARGAAAGWLTTGVVLVLGLAAVAIGSPYMRERMAASSAILDQRLAHWDEALRVASGTGASWVLGAGTGRFPALYFWGSARAAQLPSYRIVPAGGASGPFLRLGGGAGLYVEQRVQLEPHAGHAISFRARATGDETHLDVAICRKGIVQSFACSWETVKLSGEWRMYTALLGEGREEDRGMLFPMTVLSVRNPAVGTVADLDDVSLRAPNGPELVSNGGFGAGMDRWFIASDDHLAWHSKNLYLQLFVESGLLGLAAFLVLVACASMRAARSLRADASGAAVIASLAGFLVVGLGDALIDSPRILLAMLIVAIGALFRFDAAARRRR